MTPIVLRIEQLSTVGNPNQLRETVNARAKNDTDAIFALST